MEILPVSLVLFVVMKILPVSLVLFVVMTACSPATELPPPGETVATFLQHIQSGEYDEAQLILTHNSSLNLNEIEEEFRSFFYNISYEVISEVISESITGYVGYVELSINAPDFFAVMDEVMVHAFYWAFEDISEEELASRIEELLVENMDSDEVPLIVSDVTVTLQLEDEQWRIVAGHAFADAVTGGLFSFAEYTGQWLPG